MITFEELRKELKPQNEATLEELKTKLKYTKKTVKRNTLKRSVVFWQAQTIDNKTDYDLAMDKYFEKYPYR